MASGVLYVLLGVFLYMDISKSAYTEGPLAVIYGQEGSSVTLHCPSSRPGVTRTWYRGFINELLYVEEADRTLQKILIIQAPGGELTWRTGRSDITVDADFNLTIGSLQFSDKTVFTCVTNRTILGFDFSRLEVYRAPVSGGIQSVQEGDSITLPCGESDSGVGRFWYDDLVADMNRPELYSQDAMGHVAIGPNPRGSYVSVDQSTFALTVSNVAMSDRRYYTCVTNYTTRAPTYAFIFLNVFSSVVVKEVPEFTSVTLPSQRPGIGWNSRWMHDLLGLIFVGGQETVGYNNRSDMTIDPATFDLTIGMARLGDDTFLTATTSRHPLETNVITRLKVYIQPFIVGLEYKQFTPGQTLKFTCTIHRVYPRLPEDGFQMSWLGTTKNATPVENSDGSWGYTVELSKTLREEDEGHNVTCRVTPQIGVTVIRSETITIFGRSTTTAAPTTPTTTTTTTTSTTITAQAGTGSRAPTPTAFRPGQTGSTPTSATTAVPVAERKNLIPIIAGTVAGALALIVLVIILGCCCNRRGGRKGESSRSGRTSQKQYINSAFHENDSQKDEQGDKEHAEQNGRSHFET